MNNFYYDFTNREKDILSLLIRGYGNKQICEKLRIKNCTLTTHLTNLYQKTDIYNSEELIPTAKRVRLVLFYLKEIGLLPSDWEIKN